MIFYVIDETTDTVDADTAKAAAQILAERNRIASGTVKLTSSDKVRTFTVSSVQSVDAVETP